MAERGTPENLSRVGSSWRQATPQQRELRKGSGYVGRGSYLSDLGAKYIPKGTFSYAGKTLGGMSGIPGMTAVGAFAGDKLAKYVGFGDYSTSGSTSYAGADDQNQISVNTIGDGIVLSHTEFVTNVTATVGVGQAFTPFQISAFNINPGVENSFPFLAQLAANFTMYEFAGLLYQYKPTSGEYGSTTSNSLGKVIMATNYDPDAAAFGSSQEMENYSGAASVKPSCGLHHGVETKPDRRLTNMLYVRTGLSTVGPSPSGVKDKVLTDLGTFFLATEGITIGNNATQTQTATIGELWVTYLVKLKEPRLALTTLGALINEDQFSFVSNVAALCVAPATLKSTNNLGVIMSNIQNVAVLASPPLNISTSATFVVTTSMFVVFPANINSGCYRIALYGPPGQGTIIGSTWTMYSALSTASSCILQGATDSSLDGSATNRVWTTFPNTAGIVAATGGQIPSGRGALVANASAGFVWDVQISAPGNQQAVFAIVSSLAATGAYQWYATVTQISQSPRLISS